MSATDALRYGAGASVLLVVVAWLWSSLAVGGAVVALGGRVVALNGTVVGLDGMVVSPAWAIPADSSAAWMA